jgi:hypothetical protein
VSQSKWDRKTLIALVDVLESAEQERLSDYNDDEREDHFYKMGLKSVESRVRAKFDPQLSEAELAWKRGERA